MNSRAKAAVRVTLIYSVVAGSWILFSDQLLNPVFMNEPLGISLSWWQSVKGLFFVAVTSILLFVLLVRQFGVQERAFGAYKESEHRWQRLLNHTPEPVLILDGRRIVYINKAGAEVLDGDERDEIVGRSIDDFLAEEEGTSPRRSRQAGGGTSDSRPTQHFIMDGSGRKRCIDVVSSDISFGGRPCVLSVWRDVTRRHQYEQQLLTAKDEAENASRIKSTILANLSHEIRTPLTAILGYSEVLERDPDAPVDESLQIIYRSGLRLRETLESILTLAELESGESPYEPERIDVREPVTSTAEIFTGQARKKSIDFNVEIPNRPVHALADRAAVSRIVMNLVSNAIKFTEEGGVTLKVAASGRDALIEVKDTGIGMEESFLPRIFDEFVQESQGLDRIYEGSGLGLTIVRQLVDLHNGTIEVDSRRGEGTRFLVTLPGTSTNG